MAIREQVLQQLRESGDFISGEEFSERLHVSRTAVWKAVCSLRDSGYTVESVTNRGYKLKSCPDSFTPEEIGAGLETEQLGKTLYAQESVDSTNEEAKRRALGGAANGSLFIAEQQTGGKGRLGRAWISPAGTGLWFSLLLRPGIIPIQVSATTLLAGLAVCRAIRSLTDCPALIKWPNDIVIGGKKVCGILTEMSMEIERVEFVVVGIGVNVNNAAFPEGIREKATSLKLESGKAVRRVALLQNILTQFETLLKENTPAPGPAFWEEYKSLCVSLGRRIGFQRGSAQVSGLAVDVAPDGGLVVRLEDGRLETVCSGEVSVQGIYGQ